MNKPELIAFIAEHAGVTTKAAAAVVDSTVKIIQSALTDEGGRIRIPNLGVFRILEQKPRKGVHPRTGKKIKIPAMKRARFYPSEALKKTVRNAN